MHSCPSGDWDELAKRRESCGWAEGLVVPQRSFGLTIGCRDPELLMTKIGCLSPIEAEGVGCPLRVCPLCDMRIGGVSARWKCREATTVCILLYTSYIYTSLHCRISTEVWNRAFSGIDYRAYMIPADNTPGSRWDVHNSSLKCSQK